MRVVIIISICLNILKLNGQSDWIELPIESSVWSDYHATIMGNINNPMFDYTIHYSYGGDTLINNQVYKKIIKEFDLNQYEGALREENKIVYFIKKNSSEEKVLYDFNIEVGTVIDSVQQYSENCYEYNCSYIKLIEKDTTQTRSRYYFGFFHENEVGEQVFGGEIFSWIEGIGSTLGLFNDTEFIYFNYYIIADSEYIEELLCMRTNDNLIYTGDYYEGDCTRPSIINNYENQELEKQIKIYPNPTNGIINISLKNNDFNIENLSYAILDIRGKSITPFERINNWEIDITNQTKGIYLLKITNGEQIKTCKIVKM